MYYKNRRLVQIIYEILLISDLRFHTPNTYLCTVDINTATRKNTFYGGYVVNKLALTFNLKKNEFLCCKLLL